MFSMHLTQGLLSLEMRRLCGDFTDVYKHPIGKSRGDRARIFLAVPTDTKFYLNIKIKPFYCKGGQAQVA